LLEEFEICCMKFLCGSLMGFPDLGLLEPL